MTTPTSTSAQGARDNFDTGPLSWVIGEIREALNRSKTAVQEAVTQDAETRLTTLRHAKSYLHQAHGALQIVDVDGVAMITETVEDLMERVDVGHLALTAEVAEAVGSAYQALIEYLDELLAGGTHQPVRLFPYYRALLEARGAERIHPADLFFPNLAIRPQFPSGPAVAADPQQFVALRKRFEMALLPFLKSTDRAVERDNAGIMRDIAGEIEGMQVSPQARAFWWVMHGFGEGVAAGHIVNEIYVKQLFARINLQIRRLCQGSPSIAERLLRDALFFIAGATEPTPRMQQIRNVYALDGQVPADYDRKRYGQVDSNALAAAKERLGQAKSMWNRIAGGDVAAADSFEHEMLLLADAGGRLGQASLTKLLRELKGIARHAARAKPGDMLGIEMATSLLFVEGAIQNIGRLSADFPQRAEALTARLLAIVTGETPADSAPWLDDMSREAQQRQTMSAVVTEMQSSLRQVEKMLDEFFRDPAQRSSLGQLDLVLHQIEGALAVLDQEDAARTVRHTRSAVQRFLAGEEGESPDVADFEQVAQNIGALSFFIETLQQPGGTGRSRFSFDDQRGVFSANLLERQAGDGDAREVQVDGDGSAPAAQETGSMPTVPTVEDELAFRQQQSAELAFSLSAEPENRQLQEQLKASLEQIRHDAALLDSPEINDRAQAGIELLARPDFTSSPEALLDIINVTVPTLQPEAPLAPVETPDSDEAIDAELLEIFLSEAEEVLGTVRQTFPLSRQQPHNQEHLTTLRRSFHTLKGSSRMVGLSAFGEAAWSIEQVLNVRLSDSKGGDAELYALLEHAADVLESWVSDLSRTGQSRRTPAALVQAAERVREGGEFHCDEPADAALPTGEQVGEEAPPATAGEDMSLAVPPTETSAVPGLSEPPFSLADFTIEEVEAVAAPDIVSADDVAHLDEAGAVPHRAEPVDTTLPADVGAATLELRPDIGLPAGLDAGVEAGLDAGRDMVPDPAPEQSANREHGVLPVVAEVIEFPTPPLQEFRLNDSIKRIGDLEISVPLHNIYLAETDELVRLLAHDLSEWRHEPERGVSVQAVHAAHSLAGSSATVGFSSLQEVAHALEMLLQSLMRRQVRLSEYEFDTLEQTVERLKFMLQKFALGEMPAHQREYARILNSIKQDLATRAETNASAGPATTDAAPDIGLMPEPDFASAVGFDPETGTGIAPPVEPVTIAVEGAERIVAAELPLAADADGDPALTLKDELDSDLLPVFQEEGRDILPQMATLLRAWHAQPADPAPPQSLLRHLHTLKGSARMAGAMLLGQHLHDMETRIENLARMGSAEPLALDELLIRYDQALQMFDQLQGGGATAPAPAAAGAAAGAAAETTPKSAALALSGAAPAAAPPVARPATAPAPLVRVRADILDRLVNQAGEVSISRSKLETEVGTLKQSLSELTENVVRLRDQLREIEMQAETQIASRMAQSGEREFDPLEFDRFTRLQELTRSMAESVNDVGSVHQNLSRTLDSASSDLATQARLTRDLQQDLMRVRMVQFASISERLYRVTRQAAKEIDKRVSLDIRGGAVEIDRGVLEKMTGPFEHLLRNAIVHGIESREARRQSGKNEVGELRVEVRQEGNEVVIQFADDGQGLDLKRIRAKAERVGLLDNNAAVPDEELGGLIFHPGFSTAEEITELAGRGIGMDVVRSEATALGGRVATSSEPGRGTCFTIHLPLTLAVTQVVLLSTGGNTFAVPSVLVEQVQQLKTNALASAYNEGAVQWQGQRVPMHYLSALLGDRRAAPVAQQYSPVLILKSGSDRVALHVDEVIGNREVVVKNIGPQLARMIGVAGATVLGSGDIVLIINPLPLAQRAMQEDLRAPRMQASDAPEAMGAVAELAPSQPLAPRADPVQGLRTQSIVMVVDDSLTVRRVTQRLLAREGYQVVLAKDGVDALEHLQSITPDVMLVDIEMPRMDGFDLTRNVRGDERTRHIPVIMITSRTAAKHRNYALELGVNEYLGKPYQEEQLLGLIAGFVSNGATTR
ncbi:MAG TPA: Hpt domain-containing protein [Noviherbaspirillum sp.]|jgi:chemosensory pili system protein ChpA (sensor histidine kinase/response regulator)|uniref:hybrid sensor histidine kinase/response regulator n=1 Tax=Noviherbaspirillum sp. TaxID=1926288 RepID=UPI002F936ADA